MPTSIKLFGKNILRALNTAVGKFLPIVDLRTGDTIASVEKNELTQPFTIVGEINTYYYNKNTKPPYWIALFNNSVNIPSLFFLKLRDVKMIGRGALVYENKVLLESAIFQREYLDKLLINHSILASLFKKPNEKFGKAIPLLNKLSNNYYHWTTESLTRLAALKEYSNENYDDYSVVIAADAPKFVRESLTELFKIRPEKIITWRNTEKGNIDKCILISYPFIRTQQTNMTNIYNLPLYKLLNTISLKSIPSLSEDPEYIIISRINVTQRKLAGEEKLQKAFPSIPFKIIYTEKMSFSEQIRMFRNAKLVIAPHGAGLINLIYATKRPVVIEIFPTTRKIRDAGAYHQVARVVDMDYYLLVKEPFNDEQDIEITSYILSEIKSILSSHQLLQ